MAPEPFERKRPQFRLSGMASPEEERRYFTRLPRLDDLYIEEKMEKLFETDYRTPEGLHAWKDAWGKHGCIPIGMKGEHLNLAEVGEIIGDLSQIGMAQLMVHTKKMGVMLIATRKENPPKIRPGKET